MNTYLTFPTLEEAAQADAKVAQYLRDKEGSKCSQWSGVYTDGKVYGILYDAAVEAAGVTGDPETNPALVITSEGEWVPYTPPAPEEPANDPR